jgi:hypothetical protein
VKHERDRDDWYGPYRGRVQIALVDEGYHPEQAHEMIVDAMMAGLVHEYDSHKLSVV